MCRLDIFLFFRNITIQPSIDLPNNRAFFPHSTGSFPTLIASPNYPSICIRITSIGLSTFLLPREVVSMSILLLRHLFSLRQYHSCSPSKRPSKTHLLESPPWHRSTRSLHKSWCTCRALCTASCTVRPRYTLRTSTRIKTPTPRSNSTLNPSYYGNVRGCRVRRYRRCCIDG
jgi:hypothetical protein